MTTIAIKHQSNSAAPSVVNQRSIKDFQAAQRHSRIVSILKKVLPLGALCVVGFFMVAIFSATITLPDISIEKAEFDGGKIVMSSPKMAGYDKKNRAYDVRAERAIQDLKRPDMVDLVGINAKLPMDEKSVAEIIAQQGTYHTKKETLTLADKVFVKGARGMDITLQNANVDIKNGRLTSNNPVSVVSKDMNLTAKSVIVEDNGKRIIFQERVRMTIQPSAMRDDK